MNTEIRERFWRKQKLEKAVRRLSGCRAFARKIISADAFEQTIADIATFLDENDIDYVLIGGVAVNYHGFARATEDIDVAITMDGYRRLTEIAHEAGYTPAPGHFERLVDPKTGVNIDVFFMPMGAPLPDYELVPSPAGGHDVRMVTRDGLIQLKASAARVRDLDDLAGLVIAGTISVEQVVPFLDPDKIALFQDLVAERDPHGPDRSNGTGAGSSSNSNGDEEGLSDEELEWKQWFERQGHRTLRMVRKQ